MILTVLAALNAIDAQEAQAEAPVMITNPDWVRRPSEDDLASVFPARALAEGVSGQAVIRCSVSADGALQNCTVIEESPTGYGFGLAVLQMAQTFRMRPQLRDGVPVSGAQVDIPLRLIAPEGRQVGMRSFRVIGQPAWLQAPTREQMDAAYPRNATGDGRAQLMCQVQGDGTLRRCEIRDATPRAFGDAALRLTEHFRLDPRQAEPDRGHVRPRVYVPFFFDQPGTDPEVGERIAPQWRALPAPEQLAASFPAAARAAGRIEGQATVQCEVTPAGDLIECRVRDEDPQGLGFGEAALGIAPSFKMVPWTSDGRPLQLRRIRLPIQFIDPQAPQTEPAPAAG
ncbi:TonB family protein [Brevundimonas sp. 2R-24]|uniref:TonB family protein n=1 Tax=Peiella sedimenti TaxID=3061083 RepID=A0ABT8SN21_9CAUL|nr:TonB family protein [Caulobacteraceae bacterium XZ-24]